MFVTCYCFHLNSAPLSLLVDNFDIAFQTRAFTGTEASILKTLACIVEASKIGSIFAFGRINYRLFSRLTPPFLKDNGRL